MYFTRNDGFEDMLVYQPTFNTLKYKNMSSYRTKQLRNKNCKCLYQKLFRLLPKYVYSG